jgi:transmembrane sensor
MFSIQKQRTLEENILRKFLEGKASPQEEQKVHSWLKKAGSKEEFDLFLEKYFENPQPKGNDQTDYQELLQKIHKKVLKSETKKTTKFRELVVHSLRVAATLTIILFSGYILIEGLRYQDENKLAVAEPEVQTIFRVTGVGEKLTLRMSDKTLITVNSQSEISFTSEYGKAERLVTLKGEAFFEISPDSLRPFRVLSNGITTTALGTAFNVFARDEKIKIALTEGKVSVNKAEQKVVLVPGQMALWETKSPPQKDFSIENFKLDEIISWKAGNLIFDRKPLGEILNDLAVWYGVQIQIEKEIDTKRRLIGTFTNKNLKDILTGLSFATGFDFEIQGKNVQIKPQEPM